MLPTHRTLYEQLKQREKMPSSHEFQCFYCWAFSVFRRTVRFSAAAAEHTQIRRQGRRFPPTCHMRCTTKRTSVLWERLANIFLLLLEGCNTQRPPSMRGTKLYLLSLHPCPPLLLPSRGMCLAVTAPPSNVVRDLKRRLVLRSTAIHDFSLIWYSLIFVFATEKDWKKETCIALSKYTPPRGKYRGR